MSKIKQWYDSKIWEFKYNKLVKEFENNKLAWQFDLKLSKPFEYFELQEANSFVIITCDASSQKLDEIKEFTSILKSKGIEVMLINYISDIANAKETDFTKKNINVDVKIVEAPFLKRFLANEWDVAIIDFDQITMPLGYIINKMNVKMAVSENNQTLLPYTNLQIVLDQNTKSIYQHILNKFYKKN